MTMASNRINDEFSEPLWIKPLSIKKVRALPSDRTDTDDKTSAMTNPIMSE